MTVDPPNPLQANANERISAYIPRHAWLSTVAIVVAARPAVHLLGTGSLFQIADRRFVVTAGHVIGAAHQYERTIGISADSEGLMSTYGEWISTVSSSEDDPFDIAVHLLSTEAIRRLTQFKFLRIDDVGFGEQPKSGVFTLFGHPGIWSSRSKEEGHKLQLKGLEYTAISYEENTENLIGYMPEYHLLLDANSKQVTWNDGSRAVFKDESGKAAVFPRDLKGISGCPVWRTADIGIPPSQWMKLPPQVIGVQTGVYQSSQVIRVTRWVAVTTLIHTAFPELRPAINLIR